MSVVRGQARRSSSATRFACSQRVSNTWSSRWPPWRSPSGPRDKSSPLEKTPATINALHTPRSHPATLTSHPAEPHRRLRDESRLAVALVAALVVPSCPVPIKRALGRRGALGVCWQDAHTLAP